MKSEKEECLPHLHFLSTRNGCIAGSNATHVPNHTFEGAEHMAGMKRSRVRLSPYPISINHSFE